MNDERLLNDLIKHIDKLGTSVGNLSEKVGYIGTMADGTSVFDPNIANLRKEINADL